MQCAFLFLRLVDPFFEIAKRTGTEFALPKPEGLEEIVVEVEFVIGISQGLVFERVLEVAEEDRPV